MEQGYACITVLMQMINWAIDSGMPIHCALTKADKLKRGPGKSAMLQVLNQYKDHPLVSAQLFSSLDKLGIEELEAQLAKQFTGND